MSTLPDHAEIVIVGGGMAGLGLAVELAQAGARDIVVLEAGPDSDGHVNATHDPDIALRMWLEPGLDPYLWRPWRSGSAPHFETMAGLRRRVGGRSLYWHGVVLPLEPWALAEPWWPAGVIKDLTVSWDGGSSLYQRVLADLDEWCGGSLGQGPKLDAGRFRLQTVPQAIRNLPGGRFLAYTPQERLAEAGDAIRLVTRAEVLDVQMGEGAVSGVRVVLDGQHVAHDVHAGIVVLAGGTIENARLAVQLLWPAGLIERPQLGRLADKIARGFIAPLDPVGLDPEILRLADRKAFLFQPSDDAGCSNLFAQFYRNAAGAVVVDAWAMGENLADEQCMVECSPTDGLRWETTVRTGYTAADLESIAWQRDELTKLWTVLAKGGEGAGSVLRFPDPERPERTLASVAPKVGNLKPGDATVTWSGPLGSEGHESGTLAFGRMLTDRHEVRGVSGLYVVGPTVYPRPGGANPTLTNLALTKRLAVILTR